MFQDSLLESGGRMKTRRGWTTAVSLGIQLLLVGVLVLLPLLYTDALPATAYRELLTAPAPPRPANPAVPQQEMRRTIQVVSSEFVNDILVAPRQIPRTVARIVEDTVSVAPCMACVLGAPPVAEGGGGGTVIDSIVGGAGRPVTPIVHAPPRVRISHMERGMLVHRVEPVYPKKAIFARIQGTVVLQAVIGRDGTVQNLRVISGNPFLAPAAVEAVSQWRYRPYMLSGQPVEVDTMVEVHFTLD